MRTQERKNLILTGVFLAALLGIFALFAIMVGGENNWLSEKTKLRAVVPSANNLRAGGVVQFQGIKIGSVRNIYTQGVNEVAIEIEIGSEHLQWIKRDSTVKIESQGLVGDKLLKIESGESDEAFRPDIDVLAAHSSMLLPDITQTGSQIAQQTDRVLAKLELLLDQLNHNGKIASTLDGLDKSAGKLNRLLTKLEKDGAADKLSSLMGELDQTLKRINKGPGSMHSLIYEDELYNQLNSIVGGAGRSQVLRYFIQKSLEENSRD